MFLKRNAAAGCSALIALGLVGGFGSAAIAADTGRNINLEDGRARIRLSNDQPAAVYSRAGRPISILGQAMATGATPSASAGAFLEANQALLRTRVEDLAPIGPFASGRHLLPNGYVRETDSYKYTIVGYTQFRGDIPVFRGSVKVTIWNAADNPVVKVGNALRDLGDFRPDTADLPTAAENIRAAGKAIPRFERFEEGRLVIWAGVDDIAAEPTLARELVAEAGDPSSPDFQRWLLIVDAHTGELLYSEDWILHIDVSGNTSGNVTDSLGSDQCGPEIPAPLPYLNVNISGGGSAMSDANGDFVIPHGGSVDVTVNSPMEGLYFFVNAVQGTEDDLSMVVSPPGPANFLHNGANNSEFIRSQANAYSAANVVRDTALFYNPMFPDIGDQTGFQIDVNENSTCNATYSPPDGPINFYASGGGCPNTGYGTIVHHEYGHHLVHRSNDGNQGQYGEGYGDVMGVLIADDPGLAYGFFGNCDQPLRNADSNIQYPCNGPIHDCGVLISSCVWDLRNELVVTEPADYIDVLGSMIFTAMPEHAASSTIGPDIADDYVVADDDDGNPLNGSPHYDEIAAAFGAHNMGPMPVVNVEFQYPNGRPTISPPGQTTTFEVNVLAIADDPIAGSGMIHTEIDGEGVVSTPMDEMSANMYEATLPAAGCGSVVRWWVSTDTVASGEVTDPQNAPAGRYGTAVATGEMLTFADNGEGDPGWSVSGNATDGQWDRGVPVDCDRGDPDNDGDGSGQCWLTDNSSAGGCNSDVDGGHTILTSPAMDATGSSASISYRRWYSNTAGDGPNADTMLVEVSDDNGATWTLIDTVGPAGPEATDGWFDVTHDLADVVGFEFNDQFRIRFDVSDLAGGSVVEAGIDAVELTVLTCDEPECPEDLDGSGVVDFDDILEVLENWGGAGPDGDADGNGVVDFQDIVRVIANWGPCE